MPSLKNSLIPGLLWIAACLTLLFALLPRPPVPPLPLLKASGDTAQAPADVSAHTLVYDIENPGSLEDLAARLFAGPLRPVPKPSASPTPAPPPISKVLSAPNLSYMGSVVVDGKKKWVVSDSMRKISFAIGPGETYAGWTCLSADDDGLTLKRGGELYRVATH